MGINFFEKYKTKKKRNVKPLDSLVVILTLVFVLSVSVLTMYNVINIKQLNGEIARYDLEINNPKSADLVSQYDEVTALIEEIKGEKYVLNFINEGKRSENAVNSKLLRLITRNLTEKMYLTTISISPEKVEIDGRAFSKIDIAQFEHNIRKTDILDNIYVDEISVDDSTLEYKFRIRFVSKVNEV